MILGYYLSLIRIRSLTGTSTEYGAETTVIINIYSQSILGIFIRQCITEYSLASGAAFKFLSQSHGCLSCSIKDNTTIIKLRTERHTEIG